jgi:hypothetical protein
VGLSNWFVGFLRIRKILRPDGRPLYQYRLEEREFHDLSELLSKSGPKAAQTELYWDLLFVLYGSEWIRRNYDGGWGWRGVFDSLNLDSTLMAANLRNRLVEDGLRKWSRTVREMNGSRRFLGTVLTEGGLPLKQLKNGSWIANVLKPSIEAHLRFGADLTYQVENRKDLIPSSFQSAELAHMLVEICEVVVKLRHVYKLAGRDDPGEFLTRENPKWREQFPLPLNDDHAENLLGVLLEAASIDPLATIADSQFKQTTEMRNLVSGEPSLVSIISNPQFLILDSPELNVLADISNPQFTVELIAPDKKEITWCKALRTIKEGKAALKILGKPRVFEGIAALSEYSIVVKNLGQSIVQIPISNSFTLFSWIGGNDLQSTQGHVKGPLCSTLVEREFDEAYLLYNYDQIDVEPYLEWLNSQVDTKVNAKYVQLKSPIDFPDIYNASNALLSEVYLDSNSTSILLSPGTPAMQTVWLLLGKTKYPASFIQSSKENGVEDVDIPFDISAEFAPTAIKLAVGRTNVDAAFDDILTQNEHMKELKAMAPTMAGRDIPVLITG